MNHNKICERDNLNRIILQQNYLGDWYRSGFYQDTNIVTFQYWYDNWEMEYGFMNIICK